MVAAPLTRGSVNEDELAEPEPGREEPEHSVQMGFRHVAFDDARFADLVVPTGVPERAATSGKQVPRPLRGVAEREAGR